MIIKVDEFLSLTVSVLSAEAIQHNQELEFQRNRERFIFLKVRTRPFLSAHYVT